jgi:putative adenylate-forming enzyme
MDKASMMESFNEMNTKGLDRDTALHIAIEGERTRDFLPTYNGVSVGLSSGTSGHRGLFAISDHERYAWAGAVLAKFLPPGKLSGHRIAFFLRANNNLYQTIDSKNITFRYFDVYESMQKHISALAEYQPTVLIAPPSVLGIIADEVHSKNISIHPQKVISVAEVLTREDERYLKKAFSQKVIFQAYQCTEGFLAHTCNKGSLHLNEDVVYIEKEFIDKRRFVPIITDFRRTTQPIVRYRLNDILVLSDKTCSCQAATSIISHIEGREDDIFLFKDKDDAIVNVFPDIIGRCLVYTKNIKEYRVTQTDYGKVVVYLKGGTRTIEQGIIKEFDRLAKKMSFVAPMIQFDEYELDLSRKLKRIERQF